jgi:hypothetical protein
MPPLLEILDHAYDSRGHGDYFGATKPDRKNRIQAENRRKIAERRSQGVAAGIHMTILTRPLKRTICYYRKMIYPRHTDAVQRRWPAANASSCFLTTMKDDSIDGIYDTLKQTAKYPQSAGGNWPEYSQRPPHGNVYRCAPMARPTDCARCAYLTIRPVRGSGWWKRKAFRLPSIWNHSTRISTPSWI